MTTEKARSLITVTVVCDACSTMGMSRVTIEELNDDPEMEVYVMSKGAFTGWSISKFGAFCPVCVAKQARDVLIRIGV